MKLKKSIRVALLILAEIFTVLFVMNLNTEVPIGMNILVTCGMLVAINLIYFIQD